VRVALSASADLRFIRKTPGLHERPARDFHKISQAKVSQSRKAKGGLQ
jgi:hypothetical protein